MPVGPILPAPPSAGSRDAARAAGGFGRALGAALAAEREPGSAEPPVAPAAGDGAAAVALIAPVPLAPRSAVDSVGAPLGPGLAAADHPARAPTGPPAPSTPRSAHGWPPIQGGPGAGVPSGGVEAPLAPVQEPAVAAVATGIVPEPRGGTAGVPVERAPVRFGPDAAVGSATDPSPGVGATDRAAPRSDRAPAPASVTQGREVSAVPAPGVPATLGVVSPGTPIPDPSATGAPNAQDPTGPRGPEPRRAARAGATHDPAGTIRDARHAAADPIPVAARTPGRGAPDPPPMAATAQGPGDEAAPGVAGSNRPGGAGIHATTHGTEAFRPPATPAAPPSFVGSDHAAAARDGVAESGRTELAGEGARLVRLVSPRPAAAPRAGADRAAAAPAPAIASAAGPPADPRRPIHAPTDARPGPAPSDAQAPAPHPIAPPAAGAAPAGVEPAATAARAESAAPFARAAARAVDATLAALEARRAATPHHAVLAIDGGGIEGRLRVSVRGETVRAVLVSSHADSRGALEAARPGLERALAERGFTEVTVAVQAPGPSAERAGHARPAGSEHDARGDGHAPRDEESGRGHGESTPRRPPRERHAREER